MVDNHPLAASFFRAAHQGDTEAVIEMLESGVPINCCHETGLQALHFAAKNGNSELATELIARGADVNVQTQKGNTALHVASLYGQTEVVKVLLHASADVNLQASFGEEMFTALYMAAQNGHQEIVMLLLAYSADPTIPTKNGATPQTVAAQQGHVMISSLLEQYELRKSGLATSEEAQDTKQGTSVEGSTNGKTTEAAPGKRTHSEGAEEKARHKPYEGMGTNIVSAKLKLTLPPIYGEAVPTPKNSPLKSKKLATN